MSGKDDKDALVRLRPDGGDHKPSVVVRAREISGRDDNPVWTPSALARAHGLEAAVSSDAIALALRLGMTMGERSGMVVFSGLDHGAGVSTIAAQVAVAMAQARWEPLLLLDANLRHPMLATRFGAQQTPGLAEVVRGEVDLEAAIQPIIQDSLYFLASGRVSTDPSGLLGSAMCAEVFHSLRLQFGSVLVDSPPVGRYVDGLVIGARAQYVTLVVRKSSHRARELREVRRKLSAVGVDAVGVCLSEWSAGPVV